MDIKQTQISYSMFTEPLFVKTNTIITFIFYFDLVLYFGLNRNLDSEFKIYSSFHIVHPKNKLIDMKVQVIGDNFVI